MPNLKETLNKYMRNEDTAYLAEGVRNVLSWNALAGNYPFNPGYDPAIHVQGCKKQEALVYEETTELVTALSEDDPVEMLDAVCDMFVVTSMLVFMYNAHSISKCSMSTGECIDFLGGIIASLRNGDSDYTVTLNPVSMLKLADSLTPESNSGINLMGEILAMMGNLDCDVRGALNEVLSSNMSKIPTIDQLKRLIDADSDRPMFTDTSEYLKYEAENIETRSAGRYNGITYSIVIHPTTGEEHVVFKDSNGKIMKPITFISPDLRKYLR